MAKKSPKESGKNSDEPKRASSMKCCPHCQDYKNCKDRGVCCEYCDHYFKGRCAYKEDLRWEQEMKEITTFGIDADVYGNGASEVEESE